MLDKMNIIENIAKWSKERLDADETGGFPENRQGAKYELHC